MPAIENLLRDELKRVADTVQPGQLRPLRIPAPGHRWHRRLLPVAAAAAVIAVAVAAVLVARPKPAPASAPGTPAVPRYYLTLTEVPDQQVHGLPVTEAVIRSSASGRITGTVKIVTDGFPAHLTVAAAPDDRSFIIGTYEPDPRGTQRTGYQEYRFFRLPISAVGRPGHLAELPDYPVPMYTWVQGIALSPDGTRLAVSSLYSLGGQNGRPAAKVEVINLVTGETRIWTAPTQDGHYYESGSPSWADGDRLIAFTWQRAQSLTNDTMTMEGVRLLDTAAPGDNLMDSSKLIVSSKTVGGGIQSVMITPDGRDVILATSRAISSGGNHGTVIAQIVEVPAGGGQPVRVLRTQTAPYDLNTQYILLDSSQVLSLDPTGRYALAQCIQFGWMDIGGPEPGRFTPLPGFSPGEVASVVAW
jgi:hypothetical protein